MSSLAAHAAADLDAAPPQARSPGRERSGKELIGATRPFAEEHAVTSAWVTVSTFALLAASTWAAGFAPHPALRLLAGVVEGLLIVRAFILYHDHYHGALLRQSWAKPLFALYGVSVLTPPRVWRQTHNYHHAHTAKLVGSNVGSYATMTVDQWRRASAGERALYRFTRHPLNMLLGVLTVFLYGMCVGPFLRNPKEHADSGLAILFHGLLGYFAVHYFGWGVYLSAVVFPLALGCAMGAYLFYAQHNFPEMAIQPRESWEYTRASLESSSYMETGPLMRYFTGNIGYHHVHHLNPSIPFYRLPEAMAALPELQHPGKTSLRLGDVVACFRLKLWDPDAGKMVGYPRD